MSQPTGILELDKFILEHEHWGASLDMFIVKDDKHVKNIYYIYPNKKHKMWKGAWEAFLYELTAGRHSHEIDNAMFSPTDIDQPPEYGKSITINGWVYRIEGDKVTVEKHKFYNTNHQLSYLESSLLLSEGIWGIGNDKTVSDNQINYVLKSLTSLGYNPQKENEVQSQIDKQNQSSQTQSGDSPSINISSNTATPSPENAQAANTADAGQQTPKNSANVGEAPAAKDQISSLLDKLNISDQQTKDYITTRLLKVSKSVIGELSKAIDDLVSNQKVENGLDQLADGEELDPEYDEFERKHGQSFQQSFKKINAKTLTESQGLFILDEVLSIILEDQTQQQAQPAQPAFKSITTHGSEIMDPSLIFDTLSSYIYNIVNYILNQEKYYKQRSGFLNASNNRAQAINNLLKQHPAYYRQIKAFGKPPEAIQLKSFKDILGAVESLSAKHVKSVSIA